MAQQSTSPRSTYADAFLSRCDPVDPEDFTLPSGRTYICPWMSIEPVDEDSYWCGNCCFDITTYIRCRRCGEKMNKHANWYYHGNECWLKHNDKLRRLENELSNLKKNATHKSLDSLEKRPQDAEEAIKHNQTVANLQKRLQDAEEAIKHHQAVANLQKNINNLQDMLNPTFGKWYDELPSEPDPEQKDMKYWSSRCRLNTMPIFEIENMIHPDSQIHSRIKERHGNRKLNLGSTLYQASLLPSQENTFPTYSPCAIQTTWEPFQDALHPDSRRDWSNRYSLGINYTKNMVWSYNQRTTSRMSGTGGIDDKYIDEDDDTEYKQVWRPFTPHSCIPLAGVNPQILSTTTEEYIQHFQMMQHGGVSSDVWTIQQPDLAKRIKPLLEELATVTNDRPLPRYQMIIDPNQFVRPRKSDGQRVWVPCEFDVVPGCNDNGYNASLVGGERAHWMDTDIIDSVATPVLNAALPLLSKLTKPYLLLEDQRLQVVVKAQSITVPQKQEDDDSPEYVGLWHIDGDEEPVAAVVLYYYDIDEALVGGNMEFLDRRPMTILGDGDTNASGIFETSDLKEALRPSSSNNDALIPNCSVPCNTGTLLVFSNYQMAHRVLRMVNTSRSPSSRKFVALFIMDPAADRLVPASAHLAHTYLYQRALGGRCEALSCVNDGCTQESLPLPAIQLVLEFLGLTESISQRRRIRNELLRSQLLPKQYLGGSQTMVCGTGNGCHTMIGWIDSMLAEGDDDRASSRISPFERPEARINALNYPPTEVDRGLSDTLSIRSEDLNDKYGSFIHTINKREEELNNDLTKSL